MSSKTSPDRLLTPFPGPPRPEEALTLQEWLADLLRPERAGYLIHGGPGSGKSHLLRYLAEQLKSDERGLPLGPFDMAVHRGQTYSDRILDELVNDLLRILAERLPGVQPWAQWSEGDVSTTDRLHYLDEALTGLGLSAGRRAVLLLDNFDAIHPSAAIGLANRLRTIFDKHKAHFTFVLTAESDLEELRDPKHIYSPLRNVAEAYMLLDLTEKQVQEHVRRRSADWPAPLTAAQAVEIFDWTGGYPALVNALLRILKKGRQDGRILSVNEAVEQCLQGYAHVEPLRTAIHQIEKWVNLAARDVRPAQVLDHLEQGQPAVIQERGARMLLAMGILGWAGRQSPTLTYRNRLIQSFWQNSDTGGKLVRHWSKRPPLFRQSKLSAQGSVMVSFFLDLASLLADPASDEFNRRRGRLDWESDYGWVNRLEEAAKMMAGSRQEVNAPAGPFHIWRDQDHLTNIGYDLNLFREQAVRQSFMPIYEAKRADVELELGPALERLLDRFAGQLTESARAKGLETLHQQWRRWSSVRVQLTRDGAIHLTLVRELANPLPIMQIQNELLGLEQELNGGELRELSVQWELVLAIAEVFMRQLAGPDYPHIPVLDITWKGADPPQPGRSLYPVRDRYVIFLLRKLCNCRHEEKPPPDQRRLIQVEDLEPLRGKNISKPWSAEQEEAYQYGRELSCLLEGVMIQDRPDGGDLEMGRFPELKLHEVQRLLEDDLSSWQNELFLASLDNALFVFQDTQKMNAASAGAGAATDSSKSSKADFHCQACGDWEKYKIKELYFPQRTVSYHDYWQCVALGMQYVIELRWGAQWVAQRTNKDLDRMAALMEKKVEERPIDRVAKLSQDLALTTRLLAHLRDASIPMFIAGADYAAQKYEHLIEVSGLRDTILNAEKNIEAINHFLNHDEEQRTHLRTEKLTRIVGVAAGVLAGIAILAVLPSMWIDFEDSAVWRWFSLSPVHKEFPELALLYVLLGATILIVGIAGIVGLWFWRKIRKL